MYLSVQEMVEHWCLMRIVCGDRHRDADTKCYTVDRISSAIGLFEKRGVTREISIARVWKPLTPHPPPEAPVKKTFCIRNSFNETNFIGEFRLSEIRPLSSLGC